MIVPAQEKDRVVIDYYAVFEGNQMQTIKFKISLGTWQQTDVPGFEEGLIGAKAG